MGEVQIEALRDATFDIEKGEICVIVGASGAGKTTLLNIIGGMDELTSGRVVLDGQEISKYNSKQLTTYRRYDVGFVFQFYTLASLPARNVHTHRIAVFVELISIHVPCGCQRKVEVFHQTQHKRSVDVAPVH